MNELDMKISAVIQVCLGGFRPQAKWHSVRTQVFAADDCQNKYDKLFIVLVLKKKATTSTATSKTKSKQQDETRERTK